MSGCAGNYWHSADSGHTQETIQVRQKTLHRHAFHQMHMDMADHTSTDRILPCKRNVQKTVPLGGDDVFKWHLIG